MQYTEPAMLDGGLLTRLAGLSKEKLAQILENRPEVLAHPWPRRLDGVVARLTQDDSLEAAAGQLTAPAVQVLCAAQLCGALSDDFDGITVSAVARVLGASVAEVTAAVDQLSAFAFAWLERDSIKLPVPLQTDGYGRYGLGQPVASILSRTTVDGLQKIAHALDLPVLSRKQALVDELIEFFRDADQVRELAASGPEGSAELLETFVERGPELPIDLDQIRYYGYQRPDQTAVTPERWAIKCGLLVTTFDGNAHMPLEVGLALRGADYKLPFTPEPPAVPVTTIASEQIAAETSAAALRLLDRMTTVVEMARAEPLPRLKNGAVGTRVIKKLAKDTGASVEEITLVLDLALDGELLEAEEPPPPPPGRRPRKPPPVPTTGLVPGAQFAHWRAGTAAARLRHLADIWWTRLDDGVEGVREVILRLLTELGPGAAPLDLAKFAELVAWHSPMALPEGIPTLVKLRLDDAAMIGAVAGNAAGGLAQALVSGLGLAKATEELVASAWATALFGTDLTAIVTGPPSTELTALLDRAADRESQGSASTWRFSPASVRRAFDNGDTAETLTEELAAVAHSDLPQPLVYLIKDVARRHGEVEILDVHSVVVGESPSLLAEIAAHRKLAKFALRVVAPTVVTSSADAVTTLAALRDAGYAPLHRSGDGTIAVRARKVAVVTPEPEFLELPEPEAREDPVEHAERLLREPPTASRALPRGKLLSLLPGDRNHAWMRLTWQLESGFPVWLVYNEPDGGKTKLLVANPELHGDELDVWCHDPGTYRRLELSRIVPGQD